MTTLLHFLNVPSLTPTTEAWFVGMAVVFAAELAVLVRLWATGASRRMPAFFCYLLSMLVFPLSFTHVWGVVWEAIINGWVMLTVIETMARLTRPGTEYPGMRDIRKALIWMAVFVALFAWTRSPEPFPDWDPRIYYMRLYTHIFAVSLIAVSLGYSVREKAEGFYQVHAGILLAWMLIFFRADRWFEPKWAAEGWFRNGVVIEAGLTLCLVAWYLMLRVRQTECLSEHASDRQQ